MNPLLRILRMGRTARGRLLLGVVAGVAAAGSAIGLGATSAWLISRAAEQPPVLYLMVAIVAVRAFGIGRGVFRYLERLVSHDGAFRVLADLRVSVYRRLERLAPAGLAEFRSGDLLSRLVTDVDALADLWLRVVLPYSIAALAGVGSVVLVAAFLPAAGAVLALSLLAVALLAPWLSTLIARRAERRVAPIKGELGAATVDLLGAAPELMVHGALGERLAELDDLDFRLTRAEARSAAGAGLGALVAALAGGAAVWAALVLGVPAVRDGALSGVVLAVVVLTPLAAHEVMSGLAPAAQQVPRLRVAAERVLDVVDRPAPVVEPEQPIPIPAGPYGLRIRGLSARWRPDLPDVLRDVDLDVAPGDRIAVVGPSGSGKSTLAAVLLRFIDPSAGGVALVGSTGEVDITAVDSDDLRRVVGLCSQDAYVFDTTIEENVRLARRDATGEEIRSALAAARLLDWVDGLPLGLATPVGEHGARMSGGQRQRLALARVLLADFPVVVLDEPTEHLDEPTAAALTRDLLSATDGRTVLLITHRTVGRSDVDQIVEIHSGRLGRSAVSA